MSRVDQVPYQPQSAATARSCNRCHRDTAQGQAFSFKIIGPAPASPGHAPTQETIKCLRCALRHKPMLKRSAIASLVVGTILTALNQGDTLLTGQWSNALFWKIPLTYCVPFIVATYGALTNSRK